MATTKLDSKDLKDAIAGFGGLIALISQVDAGAPGAREQLEAIILRSTHDKSPEVTEKSRAFWRELKKQDGLPDGVDVEALIARVL